MFPKYIMSDKTLNSYQSGLKFLLPQSEILRWALPLINNCVLHLCGRF